MPNESPKDGSIYYMMNKPSTLMKYIHPEGENTCILTNAIIV